MLSAAMAYFWFKRLTETSTPVYIRPENQVHIFISNSGKLFFSELATSDDGTYFCSVSLTSRHGAQKYIGASQSPMSTSLGVQLHVEKGGETWTNVKSRIKLSFVYILVISFGQYTFIH